MEQVTRLLLSINAECAERYRTIMADSPEPSLVRKTSLVTLAQQSVQQRSEAWSSTSSTPQNSPQGSIDNMDELDDGIRRDSGYRSKRISMYPPSLHDRAVRRSSSLVEEARATVNPVAQQTSHFRSFSPQFAEPRRQRTPSPMARSLQRTPDPTEQLDADGCYLYEDPMLASKDSGSSSGTPTRRSLENVLDGLSSADLELLQSLTLDV